MIYFFHNFIHTCISTISNIQITALLLLFVSSTPKAAVRRIFLKKPLFFFPHFLSVLFIFLIIFFFSLSLSLFFFFFYLSFTPKI